MFHQVNDKKTFFYPGIPVNVFDKLCRYIAKHYTVIHVSEIEKYYKKTSKSAVIITFDDSHYDIIQNAYPVLKKYHLKFNINIDTETLQTGQPQDYVRIYDILNQTQIEKYFDSKFMTKPINIDRKNPAIVEMEFTEVLSSLNKDEKREYTTRMAEFCKIIPNSYSKVLSQENIKYLKNQGVEIGSHGHSHCILTTLSNDLLLKELIESKKILEEITTDPIKILAYPNGLYNADVENQSIQVGYEFFLKTEDKVNYIRTTNTRSYYRINQYHQSIGECLANIYGIHEKIRKLI